MFDRLIALALVSQESAPAPTGLNSLMQSPFFLVAAIVVMFYFLMYRPEQKRRKEREAQIKALDKGSEVVTAGGIQGKVVGVAGDVLTVEIAQNVKVKVGRQYLTPLTKDVKKTNGEDKKDKI